ncbi:hypothetical protein [Mesorhizobium sp. M0910]|uniref:hypothetical protein n=1 Tax=Mesorhizobium sp. M0910 TaxID=2957025 RepID=UPI0033351BCB
MASRKAGDDPKRRLAPARSSNRAAPLNFAARHASEAVARALGALTVFRSS